jgi:hypothetical protein
MKEQETLKMELLLTLNDSIIVQRFFNVKGFIPETKNSLDLYEYLNDVIRSLEYDLKMKTVVYMIDNQNLIYEDPSVLNTSMTDGSEYFNIYIKINEQTICHRQFDAKKYPPKVRYTVDVRPHLKSILRELTDIFSSENLTYEYLGLPLSV